MVLPLGFTLAYSSVNGEIMQLADGRIKISFFNWHGFASDVEIRGRALPSPLSLPQPDGGSERAATEVAFDNTEYQYEIFSNA